MSPFIWQLSICYASLPTSLTFFFFNASLSPREGEREELAGRQWCGLGSSCSDHRGGPPGSPGSALTQGSSPSPPCAPHLVWRHRKVWMGRGMPRPLPCSWPSELFLFTMMVAPGSWAAPRALSLLAAASCSPQLSSPPSPRLPPPGSPFPRPSPRAEHGCGRRAGLEPPRGDAGGACWSGPRRPRALALLSAPPTVLGDPSPKAGLEARAGDWGLEGGWAVNWGGGPQRLTLPPSATSSAQQSLAAPHECPLPSFSSNCHGLGRRSFGGTAEQSLTLASFALRARRSGVHPSGFSRMSTCEGKPGRAAEATRQSLKVLRCENLFMWKWEPQRNWPCSSLYLFILPCQRKKKKMTPHKPVVSICSLKDEEGHLNVLWRNVY